MAGQMWNSLELDLPCRFRNSRLHAQVTFSGCGQALWNIAAPGAEATSRPRPAFVHPVGPKDVEKARASNTACLPL